MGEGQLSPNFMETPMAKKPVAKKPVAKKPTEPVEKVFLWQGERLTAVLDGDRASIGGTNYTKGTLKNSQPDLYNAIWG